MGNLNEGYFPPSNWDYFMMFVLSPWGFIAILLTFIFLFLVMITGKDNV